jgi:hypothetical protein
VFQDASKKLSTKKAVQEKGEKSEGIRGTAQAEWKKRNLPLASTSERLPRDDYFGRGFRFWNGAEQG